MRKFAKAALALALMLAMCGTSLAADFKLGLMCPQTGKWASEGMDMKNVVMLLVDKVNNQGGINGQKIELIIEDDAGDPRSAALAAQNLLSEGKKLSEIPQPGPWASQNPPADGIVLESDQDSIQRIVGKHREENHHRYQHEHKLAVSAQTFPECLSFHGLRPP